MSEEMRLDLKVIGLERTRERLAFLALPATQRRTILRRVAKAIADRLKKQIRAHVRQSPVPEIFPSREERTAAARRFSRTVAYRATADQAVVFDKGVEHEKRLKANATVDQARRLRELGFRLSLAYIRRNFSFGLAGLIIRELENELKRKAPKRRGRGSIVLAVWRIYGSRILDEVDIRGLVKREMALA